MNIILASDHRGAEIRHLILEYLLTKPEYTVTQINDQFPEHVDYPDVAACVAQAVGTGTVDRGILICGTGVGMCVVANKFPSVRAAPCHNEVVAELSRRHNDSNILCLSGDLLGERSSLAIVEVWLVTPFDSGRHHDRLRKIKLIEQINYQTAN
jgi:ribose 5-phosphate isomerase B